MILSDQKTTNHGENLESMMDSVGLMSDMINTIHKWQPHVPQAGTGHKYRTKTNNLCIHLQPGSFLQF